MCLIDLALTKTWAVCRTSFERVSSGDGTQAEGCLSKKLKSKDFEKHFAKLQAELVKLQYCFEVSQKEQTKRFLGRISDGRKVALR